MTPVFDPENDRPAPALYTKALPPEFIRPCELAELEERAEKAETENAELKKENKMLKDVIFALRMQAAKDEQP